MAEKSIFNKIVVAILSKITAKVQLVIPIKRKNNSKL